MDQLQGQVQATSTSTDNSDEESVKEWQLWKQVLAKIKNFKNIKT
jgi:hypothetical protein